LETSFGFPQKNSLYNTLQGLPTGLQRLGLCLNDHSLYRSRRIIEGFSDILRKLAPLVKTFVPALKEIAVIDWHPFVGIFPCETDMAMLQDLFTKEDIVLPPRQGQESMRMKISTI
jgi:hypothetical protein